MLTNLPALVDSLMTHLALQDEDGQAIVEYGLLLALIAVVCVGVLVFLGGSIETVLQNIANVL